MHGRFRDESSPFPNDRRTARRFPIQLKIKFNGLLRDTEEQGIGFTVNMGSKGLMFTTDTVVTVGSWLGFLIDWPTASRTENVVLAARGRVVHVSEGRIGVALNWHEFRRGEAAAPTTPPI